MRKKDSFFTKTSGALIFSASMVLWMACDPAKPTSSEDSSAMSSSTSSMEDELNQAIVMKPNDPLSYHNRAQWKLGQGQPQGAFDDWGLALKADSSYALAWEGRTDMLYRMQKFEDCMNELNQCISWAPSSTMCLLKRAEIYVHLNQFEKAFTDMNAALRIDDQLHEAYWMKGKIYAETGEMDKAQSSFQTAVEVNPEFFDGFVTLGVFMAQQQNPMAEEYYQSAMELRPNSIEPIYNLAMYLQDSGRYDEAIALYNRILELDPENATASFNIGFIHLEYFGQYEEAIAWFSNAIDHLPYYHQAFYNRGLAQESLGRVDFAIDDYSQALKFKPDYTSAALAKGRALKSR